jgi:hypothetical protein
MMDSRKRKTITLVVKKTPPLNVNTSSVGVGCVVGLDQGGVEWPAILADPLCSQPTVITDQVAVIWISDPRPV